MITYIINNNKILSFKSVDLLLKELYNTRNMADWNLLARNGCNDGESSQHFAQLHFKIWILKIPLLPYFTPNLYYMLHFLFSTVITSP